MAVSDEIATRIKVSLNTTELDKLSDNSGIISELKDVVADIKGRLEDGANNLAEAAADQLKQYEELFFNEHEHPFETGTGRGSFVMNQESDKVWLVDNVAENRGFPYMVTDELGTNPGRKLPPHPFAKPAREALTMDIDKLVKENINL